MNASVNSSFSSDSSYLNTSLNLRRRKKDLSKIDDWQKLVDHKSILGVTKRKSSKEWYQPSKSPLKRNTLTKSKRSIVHKPFYNDTSSNDDSEDFIESKSIKLRRKPNFKFDSWDSGKESNETQTNVQDIRDQTNRRSSIAKTTKAHSTLLHENDSKSSLHLSDISLITDDKSQISQNRKSTKTNRESLDLLNRQKTNSKQSKCSISKRKSNRLSTDSTTSLALKKHKSDETDHIIEPKNEKSKINKSLRSNSRTKLTDDTNLTNLPNVQEEISSGHKQSKKSIENLSREEQRFTQILPLNNEHNSKEIDNPDNSIQKSRKSIGESINKIIPFKLGGENMNENQTNETDIESIKNNRGEHKEHSRKTENLSHIAKLNNIETPNTSNQIISHEIKSNPSSQFRNNTNISKSIATNITQEQKSNSNNNITNLSHLIVENPNKIITEEKSIISQSPKTNVLENSLEIVKNVQIRLTDIFQEKRINSDIAEISNEIKHSNRFRKSSLENRYVLENTDSENDEDIVNKSTVNIRKENLSDKLLLNSKNSNQIKDTNSSILVRQSPERISSNQSNPNVSFNSNNKTHDENKVRSSDGGVLRGKRSQIHNQFDNGSNISNQVNTKTLVENSSHLENNANNFKNTKVLQEHNSSQYNPMSSKSNESFEMNEKTVKDSNKQKIDENLETSSKNVLKKSIINTTPNRITQVTKMNSKIIEISDETETNNRLMKTPVLNSAQKSIFKKRLFDSDTENTEIIINNRKTSYGGFKKKLLINNDKHSSNIQREDSNSKSEKSMSAESFIANKTFNSRFVDDVGTDDENTNDNLDDENYISNSKRLKQRQAAPISNDHLNQTNISAIISFKENLTENKNTTINGDKQSSNIVRSVQKLKLNQNSNSNSEMKTLTNFKITTEASKSVKRIQTKSPKNYLEKKTTQLSFLKFLEQSKKIKERLDKEYEEKYKSEKNFIRQQPMQHSQPTKIKQNKPAKNKQIVDDNFKMIDGKKYKKPKVKQLAKWIQPNLKSKIFSVLNNKYDEDISSKKTDEILHFLEDVVKQISSSKKTTNVKLIDKLKLKLADANVIRTTYEFYNFVVDYCPQAFIIKVCPMRKPNTRDLTVPFDPETVFDPIINFNSTSK